MVAARERLHPLSIVVGAESPTCEQVEQVARGQALVHLDRRACARVADSFAALVRLADAGAEIYGLTTGVGALDGCRTRGAATSHNLLRSHAAGVGAPLPVEVVRAMMFARVCDLAAGHSGISLATLSALVGLLNRGVTPVVPSIGSVGASDLAPLAHVGLVIAGEGSAIVGDTVLSGSDALALAGIPRPSLQWRDGLALINGLSLSEGAGALAVVDAGATCALAEQACALTMLGLASTTTSVAAELDKSIDGSRQSAAAVRALVDGAASSGRLREPLSTRTAHHVAGAAREATTHARAIVEAELSRCTDNPMIRGDGWHTSNAGNFDGSALAHSLDYLANAITSLATASERRIARLLDPVHSGLPAFLISPRAEPGVHSGFMVAQYTAAAIVAELRTSSAAGVHSMPTCAGTEDHVSMSALAARRALHAIELVRIVVAIELLCAAQAVDLRGVALPEALAPVYQMVRDVAPTLESDRAIGDDIERVRQAIVQGDR